MSPVGTCCGTVTPRRTDSATSALFDEHLDWAASVGRRLSRGLPPSFDPDDLQQIALIEHWRRVKLYDDSTGVPYRAYAYLAIRGAVLMACRRKHYREATHDPLPEEQPNETGGRWTARGEVPTDERPLPDHMILAEEQQQRLAGSTIYVRRLRVLMALKVLSPEDAELVRQVLRGADWFEFDTATKVRLSKATRMLKRELAQGRRVVAPSRAVRKRSLPE